MFKPDDNTYEQSHFASVLALSKENLSRYRQEEKSLSDELYTLLETYGAKDVEALSMINNIQVMYERAKHEAARAEKARQKPFFGRIDFIDEKNKSKDTIYIGKVEILIVVVQNVGYSVHRHRGLSRACGTLHYHAFVGGLSYNIILFLLYRGDNLAENSFLILGEVFV